MVDSGFQRPSITHWRQPWVRGVLTACFALAILAAVVEGFARLDRYAGDLLQKQNDLPLRRLILIRTPPWLSRPILDDLAGEAVGYACNNKRHPEYATALRNPLNGRILRAIARHFMTHQAEGMNAWIKRVVMIRRVWLAHEQVIEVYARYRKPAGLVAMANHYYLISAQATRLPGVYLPTDASALSWLIQIRGVKGALPPPGKTFTMPGIRTGLKLISLLTPEPFARQITAVNVRNLHARQTDSNKPMAPQIVLITRWNTKIWWGLPPGKEGFYEVPASRKLESLLEIYRHYGRVDAGKPYVDIRLDQVLVPRPPKPAATEPGNLPAN